MSPHEEGMTNKKKIRGGITVGNGEVIVAKMSGDIPCEIQDMHGKSVTKALISDVVLTKGTPFNLLSLTKLMRQGWILGGDSETGITLTKANSVLAFNIPIETPRGVVFAVRIQRTEVATPALLKTMNVEEAHRLLGHQSEEATRKTAKHLGWTLTKGSLPTCLPCTIGTLLVESR
jgi:hypothetical protein